MIKKLDNSFFIDNYHLYDVLDCYDGVWDRSKVRGYGIVVISFDALTFAIPLRSNINHGASYITVKCMSGNSKGKGLDFSKALLITKQSYISNISYKIPHKEHKKIKNKSFYIMAQFEKYVSKYISAIQNSNQFILNDIEYRFTTLSNYHNELGLT